MEPRAIHRRRVRDQPSAAARPATAAAARPAPAAAASPPPSPSPPPPSPAPPPPPPHTRRVRRPRGGQALRDLDAAARPSTAAAELTRPRARPPTTPRMRRTLSPCATGGKTSRAAQDAIVCAPAAAANPAATLAVAAALAIAAAALAAAALALPAPARRRPARRPRPSAAAVVSRTGPAERAAFAALAALTTAAVAVAAAALALAAAALSLATPGAGASSRRAAARAAPLPPPPPTPPAPPANPNTTLPVADASAPAATTAAAAPRGGGSRSAALPRSSASPAAAAASASCPPRPRPHRALGGRERRQLGDAPPDKIRGAELLITQTREELEAPAPPPAPRRQLPRRAAPHAAARAALSASPMLTPRWSHGGTRNPSHAPPAGGVVAGRPVTQELLLAELPVGWEARGRRGRQDLRASRRARWPRCARPRAARHATSARASLHVPALPRDRSGLSPEASEVTLRPRPSPSARTDASILAPAPSAADWRTLVSVHREVGAHLRTRRSTAARTRSAPRRAPPRPPCWRTTTRCCSSRCRRRWPRPPPRAWRWPTPASSRRNRVPVEAPHAPARGGRRRRAATAALAARAALRGGTHRRAARRCASARLCTPDARRCTSRGQRVPLRRRLIGRPVSAKLLTTVDPNALDERALNLPPHDGTQLTENERGLRRPAPSSFSRPSSLVVISCRLLLPALKHAPPRRTPFSLLPSPTPRPPPASRLQNHTLVVNSLVAIGCSLPDLNPPSSRKRASTSPSSPLRGTWHATSCSRR